MTEENVAVESYTTETPAAAQQSSAPRAALTVPGAAVGRRKQAVARVRLVPGNGTITVNGREFADYFPNKLHQQLITDPFTVLELGGAYDVTARIDGGGPSGQAGALRLAIASSTYRVSANVEPIKLYQLDPLPTVAKVIINQGPEPFECVNLRLKEGGDAATPPPANPQPQPPISPESGFAGAPLAEAAPPVSGSGSQLNCVVPDGIKVFNGLAAKLEISLGRAEGVLTVPRTAVQGQGANGSVWVYDDKGEPVETKVVLGLSDGNLIEVKEGLKEGQAILEYVPGTEPAPAEDELYGGVGVSGYGG